MVYRLIASGFAACALLMLPAPADACSCVGNVPLCESFWRTPVVFAGEVLTIEPIPDPSGSASILSSRLVRFRVDETYRGELGETVEIATGAGGGDCGYRFDRGGRYLVYAERHNGRLTTSICSRTRQLSRAAEDLAYIASPASHEHARRVFGQATLSEPPERPARGYRVVMSSAEGKEWSTRTDARGHFEFRGAPAGTYDVRLIVADSERVYGGPRLGRQVELPDARGCASVEFSIVPNGRLVTRAVDRHGSPLAGIRLEVLDANALARVVTSAETGPDGQVTFSPLPPGRYLLAINHSRAPERTQPFPRLYYPAVAERASARVLTIRSGQRLDLEPFALPAPLEARALTGVITWPDGQPAAGIHVYVVGAGTSWSSGRATSGPDGTFSIVVYEGVTYSLRATHAGPPPDRVTSQARVDGITISGSVDPVRAVLRPLRR